MRERDSLDGAIMMTVDTFAPVCRASLRGLATLIDSRRVLGLTRSIIRNLCMPRSRTRTQLNRYRYELAAAILLTVSALGFLALAALNNEQENWPAQLKIQSPGQHP